MKNSNEVDKKLSYIYFKPFNERKHVNDWHFAMPEGEQIEAVALGSDWAAVSTDSNHLRVFTLEG